MFVVRNSMFFCQNLAFELGRTETSADKPDGEYRYTIAGKPGRTIFDFFESTGLTRNLMIKIATTTRIFIQISFKNKCFYRKS